ncbi:MAG: hypothetical protein ACK5T0_02605 [Vampirovibrionales bacterium]
MRRGGFESKSIELLHPAVEHSSVEAELVAGHKSVVVLNTSVLEARCRSGFVTHHVDHHT